MKSFLHGIFWPGPGSYKLPFGDDVKITSFFLGPRTAQISAAAKRKAGSKAESFEIRSRTLRFGLWFSLVNQCFDLHKRFPGEEVMCIYFYYLPGFCYGPTRSSKEGWSLFVTQHTMTSHVFFSTKLSLWPFQLFKPFDFDLLWTVGWFFWDERICIYIYIYILCTPKN